MRDQITERLVRDGRDEREAQLPGGEQADHAMASSD
jgi:hypothetical protein